jgi:hypothetical protein
VGTALVGVMFALFDKAVAWKIAMVAAALLVAFVGALVYFFLVPDPKHDMYRHETIKDADPEVAARIKEEELAELPPFKSPSMNSKGSSPSASTEKGVSFLEAWLIPGVRKVESFAVFLLRLT